MWWAVLSMMATGISGEVVNDTGISLSFQESISSPMRPDVQPAAMSLLQSSCVEVAPVVSQVLGAEYDARYDDFKAFGLEALSIYRVGDPSSYFSGMLSPGANASSADFCVELDGSMSLFRGLNVYSAGGVAETLVAGGDEPVIQWAHVTVSGDEMMMSGSDFDKMFVVAMIHDEWMLGVGDPEDSPEDDIVAHTGVLPVADSVSWRDFGALHPLVLWDILAPKVLDVAVTMTPAAVDERATAHFGRAATPAERADILGLYVGQVHAFTQQSLNNGGVFASLRIPIAWENSVAGLVFRDTAMDCMKKGFGCVDGTCPAVNDLWTSAADTNEMFHIGQVAEASGADLVFLAFHPNELMVGMTQTPPIVPVPASAGQSVSGTPDLYLSRPDSGECFVVSRAHYYRTDTFAHEVGHLISASHDANAWNNPGGGYKVESQLNLLGVPPVPYSYGVDRGYIFNHGSRVYGTVMAYGVNRVLAYSNPDMTISISGADVPLGRASFSDGQGNEHTENEMPMEISLGIVSSYRDLQSPTPSLDLAIEYEDVEVLDHTFDSLTAPTEVDLELGLVGYVPEKMKVVVADSVIAAMMGGTTSSVATVVDVCGTVAGVDSTTTPPCWQEYPCSMTQQNGVWVFDDPSCICSDEVWGDRLCAPPSSTGTFLVDGIPWSYPSGAFVSVWAWGTKAYLDGDPQLRKSLYEIPSPGTTPIIIGGDKDPTIGSGSTAGKPCEVNGNPICVVVGSVMECDLRNSGGRVVGRKHMRARYLAKTSSYRFAIEGTADNTQPFMCILYDPQNIVDELNLFATNDANSIFMQGTGDMCVEPGASLELTAVTFHGPDEVWGSRCEEVGYLERYDTRRGKDIVFGHAGDDIIISGQEQDHVSGGAGNDVLVEAFSFANSGDVLVGGVGDDAICSRSTNASLFGDEGGVFEDQEDYVFTSKTPNPSSYGENPLSTANQLSHCGKPNVWSHACDFDLTSAPAICVQEGF